MAALLINQVQCTISHVVGQCVYSRSDDRYTSAHLCPRYIPHIDVIAISMSVKHVGVDVLPAVGHSDVDIRVVDHILHPLSATI